MIFLDDKALRDKRVAEGYTVTNRAFAGRADINLESKTPDGLEAPDKDFSITMASGQWEGTEGHAKLWEKLEGLYKKGRVNMAAMLPDDWNLFQTLTRQDVTRRFMAEPDYTAVVGTEINNPAFSKAVALDEVLPWGAAFETIYGNNDAFPLMEHKTGATENVTMELFGVGDKSSLQEQLFSGFYDLQKRNEAVARGYAALRNSRNVLGKMVAKTTATGWDATQQVAADATAGASKEALLYNTIVAAIKKLYTLVDPQTGLPINTPDVFLAIPKGTEFAFQRALNGQLNNSKGTPSNYEALNQISTVIPYRGDTIYMGKKTYSYPGVASGKAYLFVPKVANWTLVKRGLTMEMGDRYDSITKWYGCQTEYDKEFFGDSAGLAASSGYCLEVSLPSL